MLVMIPQGLQGRLIHLVVLDSGRPNENVMGKEKHVKGKPLKRSM